MNSRDKEQVRQMIRREWFAIALQARYRRKLYKYVQPLSANDSAIKIAQEIVTARQRSAGLRQSDYTVGPVV